MPAVWALAAAFGYPLVEVIRFSFYSGAVGDLTYVGTANYEGLWQDPVFVSSLLNNLKLLATVPIMTVLALIIALILNAQVRGWQHYRAIVFLPYILPATAIGLTFSFLLEQRGVLNTQLVQWHLGFLAADWLGSAANVVPTIGGVIIWQQLGFGIVVFAAALLAVPQELVEAAKIDGATGWQIQWSILLPQIRRVIEFFMIVEAITVLSAIFTYVYVLTKGGPAESSSVMEYYIFENGFANGAIGVASAAVVVLLCLASVLIFVYLRMRARSAEVTS
ncbi:carbohydrate ABC transporter permease [Acidisoma cladoniae]|uniref:carbohydrate ABC transporter permease n=1 Tax=Acidisoma cladoniae TaxID=3040935 RepID=UPI00254C9D9E|nr:sugar ABC transporter permease [Acidisoma sp. PAMC 29798]